MKAVQRKPWINIDPYNVLCSFCRFANPESWGLECAHPLDAVNDRYPPPGMESGEDCWGFRPTKGLTLESAAAWIADNRAESEGT